MNKYKEYLNNAFFYNSLKKTLSKKRMVATCSFCPLRFSNWNAFFGTNERDIDCFSKYRKLTKNIFNLLPIEAVYETKNFCFTMQREMLKVIEQRCLTNE